MEVLEKLGDLFYETIKKIDKRTDLHNQEQQQLLLQNINQIAETLIKKLQYYRMSSQVLGNVEKEFHELMHMMCKMNQGKSERLAEESIQLIKKIVPNMEEMLKQGNIENTEKESEIEHQFSRVDDGVMQRNEENKQPKDYMYIKNCINTTYQHIQRDIASYIETYGVVSLQLNKESIEGIKEAISCSYNECVQDMIKKHDIHIDTIAQEIEGQVKELQQNVEDVIDKDKESVKEGVNAQQLKDDNLFKGKFPKSFDDMIKLSGQDLEKFNQCAGKAVEESKKERPKEQEDLSMTLPGNVIE